MKQHSGFLVTGALALIVSTLMGCNEQPRTAPAPAASSSVSVGRASASAAGAGAAYKLPANICTAADTTAFNDLYPGKQPTAQPVPIPTAGGTKSAAGMCTILLGSVDSNLGISVGAEVFSDARDAKAQYEQLRGRVFADYPSAKAVPGLGDGAYLFTNERLGGVRLVVLHGNAHNSIAVLKRGNATYPPDLEQRMITMTETMLTKMPRA